MAEIRNNQLGTKKLFRQKSIFAVVAFLGIFFSAIFFVFTSSSDNSDTTLQQLFRHGERTPLKTYPNDPHKNYPWENGFGALRKAGILRMYKLGQWMRKRYGHLTGDRYSKDSVEASSTASDRCIMSLQAFLAGMYPPSLEDAFTKDLLWQPIPVHYLPIEMDKKLIFCVHSDVTGKCPCPRLEQEWNKENDEDRKKWSEESVRFYEKLTKFSGDNISVPQQAMILYDTLSTEKEQGLELPDWAKGILSKLKTAIYHSYDLMTSNALQKRLRGGPLLKSVFGNMNDFRNNKTTNKVTIYSAHDVTLVNTLRTMGVRMFDDFIPELGANLIFEHRKVEDGRHIVKVLFMVDSKLEKTEELKMLDCEKNCSLDQMITGLKEVMPENWEEECKIKPL